MDAILTFHSLDDSGSVISYRPGDFAALVEGLVESGVEVVSLDGILTPRNKTGDRVAITFDDGIRTVRTEASPVLIRHGLPATVYVVSSWVGRTNRWPSQPADAPDFDLMSWDELEEIRGQGFEIASHGATHVSLGTVGTEGAAQEAQDSKRRIEDRLGGPVRHFAYPYGHWNDASVRAVRAAYASAVTTRMDWLGPGDDAHLLPRIDAYYLQGRWSRLALFGARTRRHLRWRAWLRAVGRGHRS